MGATAMDWRHRVRWLFRSISCELIIELFPVLANAQYMVLQRLYVLSLVGTKLGHVNLTNVTSERT